MSFVSGLENPPNIWRAGYERIAKRLRPMKTIYYISLGVSLVLIISGFLIPPMGVIDGSVLTAVGELLMFPLLLTLPEAIKAGRSVKVEKNGLSVELTTPPDEEK